MIQKIWFRKHIGASIRKKKVTNKGTKKKKTEINFGMKKR